MDGISHLRGMGRAGRSVRRRGFTLVELLVVVGIVALLVTILMPSLGRALALGRKVVCQSNLRQLGTAWVLYWGENRDGHPSLMSCGQCPRGMDPATDFVSQVNDQLCDMYGHLTGAGRLWGPGYVQERDLYVCPSVNRSVGGGWWDEPDEKGGTWPPAEGDALRLSSWMTYGLRRMARYDDPSLATADGPGNSAPETDEIMLMKRGVNGIPDPSGFSLMADCFRTGEVASRSHPPKVNVLYLDSHVGDFEDTTADGSILYESNGIKGGHHVNNNWKHDDIWMIIDRYHRSPVGSGNR